MTQDKYKKEKVTITISKSIIKKIDKIKKFPKWKDNRSELIEYILEDFLNKKGENK